jgi:hypothetical protein
MRMWTRTATILGVIALLVAPAAEANEPREHDGGFFARLAVGGGYASTSTKDDFGDKVELNGPSFDFDVALGVGIGRNFIVHASVFGWSVVDPTIEVNGVGFDTDDVTLSLAAFGPGVTYYFGESNFYLTGAVGIATQTLKIDRVTFDSDTGWAMQVGLGKEWWVGDRWGVGVAAGFNYHSVPSGESDVDDLTGPAFGLRFSATYN